MKSEKAPSNRRGEGTIRKECPKLRIPNHQISVLPVAREAGLYHFPFISQSLVVEPGHLPHSHSIRVTARCTPTPVSKRCLTHQATSNVSALPECSFLEVLGKT